MNIKLVNCYQELNEFINHERTIKTLKRKLGEGLSAIDLNRTRQQLSLAKEELRHSFENILGTIPCVKVESQDDYEGLKQLVNYIISSTEIDISNTQKIDLVNNLCSIEENGFKDEIQSYATGLFQENMQVTTKVGLDNEYLIANLHEEFKSGKQNPIITNLFSHYYLLSDLIAKNDNGDNGKEFVDKLISDKQVPAEYKKTLKKVYHNYRIDKVFESADPSEHRRELVRSRNLDVLNKVISFPLKAVSGIIKITGEVVNLISKVVALPFDALTSLITSDNDSNASFVAGVIIDLPGIIVKSIGGTVKLATQLLGAGVDLINKGLQSPLQYISESLDMESGLPAESVVNRESKKVFNNLYKALKKNYRDIDKSRINIILGDSTVQPFNYNIDENNVLSIKLRYKGKQDFILKYQIDERTAKRLQIFKSDIEKLKEVKDIQDIKADPHAYYRRIKAPYFERRYLANITTQEPIGIESRIFNISDEVGKTLDEILVNAIKTRCSADCNGEDEAGDSVVVEEDNEDDKS